ncbi:hypothetical protein KFE25_013823 [Diacronema lutheri]|uniref:Uncharacterized protein n=2 Tax=Diacronema lutheri TaxID=2081491 RepID=A0A8J6CG63_DIALT|nr:hypothetical protein KFE25_013823 [Diacronema lutheri]
MEAVDAQRPLVWDELAARLHPGEADELARLVGRSRIDENATLSAELHALLEIHAELTDGTGELLARESLLRSLEPPGRQTVAAEIAAFAEALRERGGTGGSAVAAHAGTIKYAQRCAAGELDPPARPGTAGSHSSASSSSRPASRASSCSTALALQVGGLRPATSGGRRPPSAARAGRAAAGGRRPASAHGGDGSRADDADATAKRVAAALRGDAVELPAHVAGARGGDSARGRADGADGGGGGGACDDGLGGVSVHVAAALVAERESLLKMSETVRLWIDDEASFGAQLAHCAAPPSLENLRTARASLEAAFLAGRVTSAALAAPDPAPPPEPRVRNVPATPPRAPQPAVVPSPPAAGASAAPRPGRLSAARRAPAAQPAAQAAEPPPPPRPQPAHGATPAAAVPVARAVAQANAGGGDAARCAGGARPGLRFVDRMRALSLREDEAGRARASLRG